MLQFEENFFKEEERCGFTVSAMMKKAWAVELELAGMLIDVCEQYDLRIYASWGTLLGAVRHQGFVPWDDDMDFDMPRSDYMKLLELIKNEDVLTDLYCSSLYTKGTHFQPSATIMNHNMVPLPQRVRERFYDFPFAVGIDLNPMDYIPENEELEEAQFLLYGILYDIAQRFEVLRENGELDYRVSSAEELCNTKFIRDNTLRQQIWSFSDKIAAIATRQESKYMSEMGRRVRGQKDYLIPYEWLDEIKWMPFENIKVPVPVGYDGILKLNYGDDYMIPKFSGAAHNYPFYKTQEEYLRTHGLL